jgi:hypothetical protein
MLRLVKNFRSTLIVSVLVVYAALLFLNSSAPTSAEQTASQGEGEIEKLAMTIKEALIKYTDELMALPGVVGTAQSLCEKTPCIKVYVIKKTPHLEKQIHRILKGHAYQIQETGKIRPRSE